MNRPGVGETMKLCMLPCHSCCIYGISRNREIGEFKVILWKEAGGEKPQNQRRGGQFLWES